MGKGVKKKEVQKNAFVIKGGARSYYPSTVTVIYDNQPPQICFFHPNMRQIAPIKHNIPTFNDDKNSFTPAFKLPSDELDLEHYQEKHKSKLEQYQPISESQIMMPRPKDKRYCHVCQCRFDDYQQHIDSQRHKKVLSEDKYQHRIQKLGRKIMKIKSSNNNNRPKTTKTAMPSDRQESFYQHQSKQNDKHSTNVSQPVVQI